MTTRPATQATGPLNIALIGSRGAPARYGGFETAVDEVGQRLAARGHRVTVYCRNGNSGQEKDPRRYRGMRLVHLPAVRYRSLETLSHSFLCVLHALRGERFDAVMMCNSANAPVLPLLRARRIPVATHVDGIEWRRSKWGRRGRSYYRLAESLAVRWSDALIADAVGIEAYYLDEFGARTDTITYGSPDIREAGSARLAGLGLEPGKYHLIVARLEPENHVDLMLEGYLRSTARYPLIVVGSVPYASKHAADLEALAARSGSIRMIGGVWDQELLDELYAGALTYLHGHSVGGTNPSLLRAMGAATATIAYDIVFNREVAGPQARYAVSAGEVADALGEAEADEAATRRRGAALSERARQLYDWEATADKYEALFTALAAGRSQRGLYTGRRVKRSWWRAGFTPVIRFGEPAPARAASSEPAPPPDEAFWSSGLFASAAGSPRAQ